MYQPWSKVQGRFGFTYTQGRNTMSADNLALWNEFEATDPAFTKSFNRGGGFTGTAINAVYILRKLTEKFGPVGLGWRFVLEHEQYVPGHFFDDGRSQAVIHVVRGHLEYRLGRVPIVAAGSSPGGPDRVADWIATGPQFGQTTFVGLNKNGLFTDEEAPKKSVTDCLGKCALQLGIGADISLGLWDDNKYVADPAATAPARKPRATKAPAAAPVVSPSGADLTNINTAVNTATHPAELMVVFDDLRRSPPIYNDLATWEIVCKTVAERFKSLPPASLETNEAKSLISGLQAERLRLDQGRRANATA